MSAIWFMVGCWFGILTGFVMAAFVAGQARPCPWCGEAPYKMEPDDVLLYEELRQ